MAEAVQLGAEPRATIGSGIKALRRSGKVPAVIYGHNIAASHVQLNERELSSVLRKIGRNSLITLNVAGSAPKMVLTREIQRDPVSRALLHIDLYEVSMSETISATIRVLVTGDALNAEIKGGTAVLLQERSTINIECLPSDLFDSVTINVAELKIGDVVRVRDLTIPSGVTVRENADEDVVRIQRFVEAKVEDVKTDTAEPEVIEKGKKDEEGEGA
jgi:large subunit ribosomal protein L25